MNQDKRDTIISLVVACIMVSFMEILFWYLVNPGLCDKDKTCVIDIWIFRIIFTIVPFLCVTVVFHMLGSPFNKQPNRNEV